MKLKTNKRSPNEVKEIIGPGFFFFLAWLKMYVDGENGVILSSDGSVEIELH